MESNNLLNISCCELLERFFDEFSYFMYFFLIIVKFFLFLRGGYILVLKYI